MGKRGAQGIAARGGGGDAFSYRFRDQEQWKGKLGCASRGAPRGRSYLRPLAAGAADVVGHPGRLIHLGTGERAGKLSSGRGTPRSLARAPAEEEGREGKKERTGCPRTGTLSPSAGVCALAALPASRLQNRTRNTPVPGTAFLPRPPKRRRGEPGSARPPPSGAAAAAGRAPHGTARLAAGPRAAPRCSAGRGGDAPLAPEPGPASPLTPPPLQRARHSPGSSHFFAIICF